MLSVNFRTILFLVGSLLIVSSSCYSAENRIANVPLVQLLQEGKAKLSSDKKSIIDEKGGIIAKQTPPPVVKKDESSNMIGDTSKDKITTMNINCNKKCAILSRQCFADDIGNVVCLNVCEKETLVCEEITN